MENLDRFMKGYHHWAEYKYLTKFQNNLMLLSLKEKKMKKWENSNLLERRKNNNSKKSFKKKSFKKWILLKEALEKVKPNWSKKGFGTDLSRKRKKLEFIWILKFKILICKAHNLSWKSTQSFSNIYSPNIVTQCTPQKQVILTKILKERNFYQQLK